MRVLATIVRWLGKTEGRDKLCKMLQFCCLLLSRIFKEDDYYNLQFETLYRTRVLTQSRCARPASCSGCSRASSSTRS